MSKPITVDGRRGPRTPRQIGRRLRRRAGSKPVEWRNVPDRKSPTPDQVRAARVYFCFTQTQAAELMGWTLNGWQRVEQGERNLKPQLWKYWLSEAMKTRT
jgi:hypothetical protein